MVTKHQGPNGFNSHFLKKYWHIVSDSIQQAVMHFLNIGQMPRQTNSTIISLVPKKENGEPMKDFCPISYCNTLYKCVSKILATRLKAILPSIISSNQSAFIQGRSITDNVLMAYELVRNYQRKGVSQRSTIKIDLPKAFDSVDWKFLRILLEAIGFPNKYVEWVLGCISTPWFSISFNGSLATFFKGAKGLCPGDPLSPYLFVLTMEVFTQLIDRAANEGKLGYHPKCKKVNITHLIFANDLMVFSDGTNSSIRAICAVLQQFYSTLV